MTDARIQKIEAQIQAAEGISGETRGELLALLAELKTEVSALSQSQPEHAQSIARFADASAHEATRAERQPALITAALSGLTASVEDFETTHANLAQVVNRIAVILSNMGM